MNTLSEHHLVTRIDSDRTDESPFGSKLTTPVDEDVHIFPTIDQNHHQKRVLDNIKQAHIAQVGRNLEADKDYAPSPTPSPSLTATDVFGPSLGIRAPRSRSASIYSQPNIPLEIPGESPDIHSEEEEDDEDDDEHYVWPFLDPDGLALPTSESHAASSIAATACAMPPCDWPLSDSVPSEKLRSKQDSSTAAKTANELFSALPFACVDAIASETTVENVKSIAITTTEPLIDEEQEEGEVPSYTLTHLAPHFTSSAFPTTLLRIALFVPWCILAGATVLVSPHHINSVLFLYSPSSPFYESESVDEAGEGDTPSPSPRTPLQRYALLADVVPLLVQIFLGALGLVAYLSPTAGAILAGAVSVRAGVVWGLAWSGGLGGTRGLSKGRRKGVGEDDDLEAVYWIWRRYICGDDDEVGVGVEEREFLMRLKGAEAEAEDEIVDAGAGDSDVEVVNK